MSEGQTECARVRFAGLWVTPTSAPWTLIQLRYLTFTHQAEQQSKSKKGASRNSLRIIKQIHARKSFKGLGSFEKEHVSAFGVFYVGTEPFEHTIWMTNN